MYTVTVCGLIAMFGCWGMIPFRSDTRKVFFYFTANLGQPHFFR